MDVGYLANGDHPVYVDRSTTLRCKADRAAASIMIRVLIASAQFLAEVPVNEQGYPNTTVSLALIC